MHAHFWISVVVVMSSIDMFFFLYRATVVSLEDFEGRLNQVSMTNNNIACNF